MSSQIAPIVIFAYKRKDLLDSLILSLQRNELAKISDLFVFVDGPRNEVEHTQVLEVKRYVEELTGFKSVHNSFSRENKGLAISVISGVTEVISMYGKAIVLEDDLIVTPNFLSYMNQCLDVYETNSNIFSICGFGLALNHPRDYKGDVYLFGRSSSWGWATWKNRWDTVDWELKDWADFSKNRKSVHSFNKNGSDMFSLLKASKEGRNSSWAIRFCYAQYKQHKMSVFPFLSKVDNTGFGNGATHCAYSYSRAIPRMDEECLEVFDLPVILQENQYIIRQRRKNNSLLMRAYSKVRRFIEKI